MTPTDRPAVGESLAPFEASSDPSSFVLLLRIAVFILITWTVYWAFRQLTVALFAPELEVVRPVLPAREVSPGSTVQLGVMIANRKPMAGAAFVVATMGAGRQVEGPTVEIPPSDTALVPVEVRLEREDEVLSLVVFDGWRGVRRLWTFSGLRIEVTETDVELTYLTREDTLSAGRAFDVELLASNQGTEIVRVRPRLSLQSAPFGATRSVVGETAQIAPGQSAALTIRIEAGFLEAGTHFAQAVVETAEGVVRGGTRYPVPLIVRSVESP